jgi:arylamine N-acetyltransferase
MKQTLIDLFESIFGKNYRLPSQSHLQWIAESFSLIPYENLTKIIQSVRFTEFGDRMRSPEDVFHDFIQKGTGGTCFSLTNCLKSILSEYGYESQIHMAHLGSGINNHCALSVRLDDGMFLIDPGYLITTPLPIPQIGSVTHETRLFPVRLERTAHGEDLFLSTIEPQGEKYRYQLRGSACLHADFLGYWKDSFNWTMMHSLLITKTSPEGRIYLHDRYFRIIGRTGKKGEKFKDSFDARIAEKTGIDPEVIHEARCILAKNKHTLVERGDNIHG